MKKLSIAGVLLCTLFSFSCKKTSSSETIFTSSSVVAYSGNMNSTLQTDQAGNPLQLVLNIDGSSISSLPSDANSRDTSFVVPLPQKAIDITPFNFIEVDWNPHGHPPVGIYDIAHFDFHFYMVPKTEVDAAIDPIKLNTDPASDYLPASYISGAPVPQMGKHWIDSNSPEMHNIPFTQTFVYGSYNGNVTFYEPMVTKAYLQNTLSFQRSIPQPAKVKKSGFYPTQISITKLNNVTQIVLDQFVYRQGS